ALEYARTFPAQTAAIILDSTVPPDGISPFEADSLAASRRVIEELCADGSCAGITSDPVADTQTVVSRPPSGGVVVDGKGRRRPPILNGAGLFRIVRGGDLRPLLQARYAGAVAAARRGDRAPLLRLVFLGELAGVGAGQDIDPAVRQSSLALQLATACADIQF